MENVMNDTSKVFESHIRIQMIASLSVSDLTYKQMKEILGCTDGNMTTHTKKLIQEGFMEVKKEFVNNRPQTTYHLTDEGILYLWAYNKTIYRQRRKLRKMIKKNIDINDINCSITCFKAYLSLGNCYNNIKYLDKFRFVACDFSN